MRDHQGITERTESGTAVPEAPPPPVTGLPADGRWERRCDGPWLAFDGWRSHRDRRGRRYGGGGPAPSRPAGRRPYFRGPLHRSTETRVLAGVCGGVATATGIDVTLVRIVFVLLCLGSGIGILAYALGWLLLPLEGERTSIFGRSVTDRRGLRLVVAIVPALVLVQVLASALHLGYLGSFSWPVLSASTTRSCRIEDLVLEVMAEAMAPALSISGRMAWCARIICEARVDFSW